MDTYGIDKKEFMNFELSSLHSTAGLTAPREFKSKWIYKAYSWDIRTECVPPAICDERFVKSSVVAAPLVMKVLMDAVKNSSDNDETLAICRRVYTNPKYHVSDQPLKEESSLVVRFILISPRTGKPVLWEDTLVLWNGEPVLWENPELGIAGAAVAENIEQAEAKLRNDAVDKWIKYIAKTTIGTTEVKDGEDSGATTVDLA